MMLQIHNHGPLILSTNYWQTDMAAAGKFYISINAGAIRLLIPNSQGEVIEAIRASQQVVLSRGPWPEMGLPEAMELLFDDLSDTPYAMHLSPESFDMLPSEPKAGQEWVLSVWDDKKGRPHKAVERRCHWRRVPRIPWLRPWP